MKVDKFESLIAWQKARTLTSSVYRASGVGRFAQDYGLKNQIRRAAVSSMSNIAEGFERGSPAEFHRFLTLSKGSCAELRNQLYVALDIGYLDEHDFQELMMQASEVARIIGGLRASVARRRDGQKLTPPRSVTV